MRVRDPPQKHVADFHRVEAGAHSSHSARTAGRCHAGEMGAIKESKARREQALTAGPVGTWSNRHDPRVVASLWPLPKTG